MPTPAIALTLNNTANCYRRMGIQTNHLEKCTLPLATGNLILRIRLPFLASLSPFDRGSNYTKWDITISVLSIQTHDHCPAGMFEIQPDLPLVGRADHIFDRAVLTS